jgi:tetratricopeptide (TPR) repeat protein
MQEIERSAQTHMKKDVLAGQAGETAVPEIEIPGTKLGLRTVVDVGRSVFGRHPKHIGGDVVFLDDTGTGVEEHRVKAGVAVTVYFLQEQVARQSLTDSVDSGDVSAIVQRLAELALRQVNPYVLAVYDYEQKRFAAVESIVEAITQDASLDKEHRIVAFELWGRMASDLGKLDEAIEKYAKALEIDPKDTDGYDGLGVALNAKGKHDEAIMQYKKVLEIDPKDASAYGNWGVALDDEGKHDEAIMQYKKVLEINPKDAIAYNNWGNSLSSEGKYDEALVKYAKSVEVDPTYARAYNNWGNVLQELGRNKEADEKFTIAEELERPHK